MKVFFSTIFLFFLIGTMSAQDLHFSQMDLNAAMRNPATLGQMVYNNKFTASYRSQWTNLPAPYRTINLAFEQRKSAFTWGAGILHNDAGRNSLRTSQVLLNFSYQKKLSERDEVLAIGVSGGVIQQRFSPESFEFDNQYVSGEGVDKTISNGETFFRTNQFLPTVTAGVFVSKYLNRIKVSTGVSFAHLNTPAFEYFEGEKENYPIRTSFFADAKLYMRKKLQTEIRFAVNQQSVANEKLVGLRLNYELSPNNWLVAGVGSRLGDAYILEGGMKFKTGAIILSYDINNSKYSAVSNSKGALELSARYGLSQRDAYKQPEIAQPFAQKMENEELPEEPIIEKGTDTDNDGIADNKDECPDIPGLLQFNGCNDSDRDGVWDSKDACPNLFGVVENRGCPSTARDSDKDGLLDDVDKCPFIKGSIAMGGCPDTDKDGISDMFDKCPFLKGDQTNYGCPKMSMEAHQDFVKNKSSRALVEFSTNKANIESEFYAQLEGVAIFLLENPKAQAFISGHTDDEGDSESNYKLGEQRAQAVMDYLLEVGVPRTQMETISYGEYKPKNANKSAIEKAKNRRVEVTVYLR